MIYYNILLFVVVVVIISTISIGISAPVATIV